MQAPIIKTLSFQTSPTLISPAPVFPTQVLMTKLFLVQISLVEVLSAQAKISSKQATSIQVPLTQILSAAVSLILSFPASILQVYIFSLINHLLNYELVQKCMQSSYLYKNGDDRLYFIDCHYQNGKFKRQDLYYHRKKRIKEIEIDKIGKR